MPCDYSKYPVDWKTIIRPDILKRAKNCCENCGVENGRLIRRFGDNWEYWPEGMQSEAYSLEGYKSVKIILTISHQDHDISNNDYSNLKALCQKCHNNHDKDYRKQNRNKSRNKNQINLL